MNTSHVAVPGSSRRPLPGARALGPASQDEWIEVTVKVRRKAPLNLPDRPAATASHADVEADYGASQKDIDEVSKVLSSNGLDIVSTDPGTRSVKAAGPASAMEKLFQVKLIRYAHERGDYRGRVGELHIPAELNGIVEGVFGLDNRRVVKQRASSAHLCAMSTAAAKTRSWYFPAELAKIYDFPQGDGAGQSIGALEFGGGFFPSDLAAFCKAAGVSVPNVVPVSVDNTPTDQHDGAEGEVMLDIEVIAGACPKALIPVYFSSFTEKGWIDVLDAAIHDTQNKPSVLSISWGDAEDNASWTMQAINQINESLKEAALLSITVCVASGDDGSDDQVGDGHAHVDFPASSPYVISVGGTTLRKHRGKIAEVAWKDGDGLRKDGGGSSGGGVSAVIDRPAWQNVNIQSVNPNAIDGRCVPDVAADASAHTGYLLVVDGKAGPNGGTSAAAPLWASLIARVNQALPGGRKAGYLTPLLYRAAQAAGPTLGSAGCRDISSGNNATAVVGGYDAGSGYDAVTGWGSPVGTRLLTTLASMI